MLFAVFLLSLGLGKAVEVHTTQVRREREAELIEVGLLYRQAIRDYYLSAPGGEHRYPAQLDDLLKDSRHLVTRRYLRRLYPDPMTGRPMTAIQAPQGGIRGVASPSTSLPIRIKLPAEVTLENGSAYRHSDWLFVYDGG